MIGVGLLTAFVVWYALRLVLQALWPTCSGCDGSGYIEMDPQTHAAIVCAVCRGAGSQEWP